MRLADLKLGQRASHASPDYRDAIRRANGDVQWCRSNVIVSMTNKFLQDDWTLIPEPLPVGEWIEPVTDDVLAQIPPCSDVAIDWANGQRSRQPSYRDTLNLRKSALARIYIIPPPEGQE